MLRGVVLGADDQTLALLCATINDLNEIDHFLWIFNRPSDLVVVTRAQIDHNVLVLEEEHNREGVIELVHLVKVGYFFDIYNVDHCKILYRLLNLVQRLVHDHTVGIPVVSEANDDDSVLFRDNGLIYGPSGCEMRKHIRHCISLSYPIDATTTTIHVFRLEGVVEFPLGLTPAQKFETTYARQKIHHNPLLSTLTGMWH